MDNYSDKIIALRKEKGTTQQEVADAIGTSRQMVSRWELGFNVPSLYYAEKLAAYFGVSLGALMGREDEEKPAADPGELADGVRARLRLLSFFMFAPALLYALFWFVEQAVIEAYAVAGIPWEEYYRVIYALYFFNALFHETLLVALGALAVYFFARAIKKTDNGFTRADIYASFRNCCFFWLWNVLNIVYMNWIAQKIEPRFLGAVACVFGSSLLAWFTVLTFDIVFKKFAGSWMTVETNASLGRLNIVYLAVSALNIAQYLVLLVLSLTLWQGELFYMLTFYLVFAGVALVLQLLYAVVRVRISRRG